MNPEEKEKLAVARNAAQVVLSDVEIRANAIKDEAVDIAKELVEHARETARQMLLDSNFDTSQIPLICKKIVVIQTDLAWVKWIVMGTAAGMFGFVLLTLMRFGGGLN